MLTTSNNYLPQVSNMNGPSPSSSINNTELLIQGANGRRSITALSVVVAKQFLDLAMFELLVPIFFSMPAWQTPFKI